MQRFETCDHPAEALRAGRDYPFTAPISGADENPAAHGCISFVETCARCGAQRALNVNQRHEEVGPWWDAEGARRAEEQQWEAELEAELEAEMQAREAARAAFEGAYRALTQAGLLVPAGSLYYDPVDSLMLLRGSRYAARGTEIVVGAGPDVVTAAADVVRHSRRLAEVYAGGAA